VAEEFAFMKAGAFIEVCTPLLTVGNVAFLAITTMDTKSASEYNRFLRRTDEYGKPLFHTFIFSLVCDACRARGEAHRCDHIEQALPPWIEARSVRKVLALLGPTFAEQGDREMRNVESDVKPSCLRGWVVDEFMALPRYASAEPVREFWVSIDPQNGAHTARVGSRYAVVSMFDSPAGLVVAGAEDIASVEPEDYLGTVCSHILRLRSSRHANNATVHILHEGNTGQEAGHLRRYLISERRLNGVEFHRRPEASLPRPDQPYKTGLRTDAAVKRDMVVAMRLAMNRNGVRIAHDFVTHHTKGAPFVLEEFARQLKALREVTKPGARPFDPVVKHITGKSEDEPDDVATAFGLGMYWKDYFQREAAARR